MRHRKKSFILLLCSIFLTSLGVLLLTTQSVKAQCGSETSSCKNCHEVQGELPVNSDGTGWHESHAFGDFCYICHAGNLQAPDKDAAHEGMVQPLSDIKASCQSCHPNDLNERADVYAKVLGVSLDSGSGAATPTAAATTPPSDNVAAANDSAASAPDDQQAVQPVVQQPVASIAAGNELIVDDPNVVDYVQRYNQIVLGEQPVNWGNVILVGLIGLIAVGGGGFVIFNETRLRRSSSQTGRVEGEYPADVVEMLPALASLKVQTRKVLKQLLSNPRKADKVLGLIDTVVRDDTE